MGRGCICRRCLRREYFRKGEWGSAARGLGAQQGHQFGEGFEGAGVDEMALVIESRARVGDKNLGACDQAGAEWGEAEPQGILRAFAPGAACGGREDGNGFVLPGCAFGAADPIEGVFQHAGQGFVIFRRANHDGVGGGDLVGKGLNLWRDTGGFLQIAVVERQAQVGLGVDGVAKGAAAFGQKQAVGGGGAQGAADAEKGEGGHVRDHQRKSFRIAGARKAVRMAFRPMPRPAKAPAVG